MIDSEGIYRSSFVDGLTPDPDLNVSQWADEYRMLSQKASAEPGRWRTDRTPYLREIMDCASDPRVSQVTWMAAAQVSKTEGVINNTVGYYMDQEPSPIMVELETDEKKKAWSKERFMPMVLETPCLADKVLLGRSSDNTNEIGYKDFPGGYLAIVSAGSEGGLSSRPIRVLLKDEIDKWPVLSAGDPDPLVDKRTSTFTVNRKIINVSTPRDHHPPEAVSRIYTKYLASDMRKYHVPCPYCGHLQLLREAQLKFTRPGGTGDTVEDVWYECENPACSIKKIRHMHKARMLERGRWIAERPFQGHAGFWISALYSPWVSWKEYAEAKLKMTRQKDTHKTFQNEWRGEPWDPVMEIDHETRVSPYLSRREHYEKVPLRAAIITAYADIQKDRIEAMAIAWGEARECWGLEHRIFWGDTAKLTTGHLPPVWQELEAWRQKTFEHESGAVLKIARLFIDMSFLTTEVLKFCRSKRPLVWPARGMSDVNSRHPLVTRRPQKDQRNRYLYYPVGPNEGKEIVFANLATEPAATPGDPAPGYVHLNQNFDAEFIKQLIASEVGKWKKGIYVYDKITPSVRNEGLDLCVGNLAAFESMGVDPKPYVDALRRQWEQAQKAAAGEAIVEKGQQETPKNRNPLGLRVISKGLRREDR